MNSCKDVKNATKKGNEDLADVSKSLPCECGSKKFWKFSNKQILQKYE